MEEVCAVDEIGDGEVKGFEVEGTEIMIARIDDDFYCLGDICTHQHCLLSDGWLEGKDVVCPCHASKFNLETGEPDRPPAKEPEPVYEVSVEDGKVMVDTSTSR